jgi:hypothetical protein
LNWISFFINKTSIDINGYYNIYNNFIGNLNVITPLYGTAFDGGLTDPEGSKALHALQMEILELSIVH